MGDEIGLNHRLWEKIEYKWFMTKQLRTHSWIRIDRRFVGSRSARVN